MKKIVYIVLLSILLTFAGSTAVKATNFMIVDFSNDTAYKIPGIENVIANIIAERLINNGFTVVERNKMNNIITEQNFAESGLIDPDTSNIELGKLIGADYILTGSLVNYDVEERKFRGYGIETKTTVLTVDLNINIVSINTGAIEFSKTYRNAQSFSELGVNSLKIDVASKARNSIKSIADDFIRDFRDIKVKRNEREKVVVEFNSDPAGASVEINGIYYGNTPVKLEVNKGIHRVVVSMGGYEVWEKRINFEEGAVVNANLGLKLNEEDK